MIEGVACKAPVVPRLPYDSMVDGAAVPRILLHLNTSLGLDQIELTSAVPISGRQYLLSRAPHKED